MTNRRLFLLELLAAVIVTVPLAFVLRPAVATSTWPGEVMAGVVFTAAVALAVLIDLTAEALRPRRGATGRVAVRRG